MFHLKQYFLSTIFVFFLLLLPGFAEENAADSSKNESAITVGAEVDFNSRYVWRGIPWSEGAVMQPSVWVSASDFTFTVWSNFVLDDEPNQGQWNEVDFTLAYSREWNKITLEPSFNYYCYPNQEDSPATGEFAVKLAYALDPVEIFTNQSVDVVKYDGAYFGDIGIGYTHEFNPQLSFEGNISLGWGSSKFNETYIGIAKSALNVAQCEVSLTYQPEHFLYFRPHLAVSTILDDELRDQLDDDTIIYGGIAIGKEF